MNILGVIPARGGSKEIKNKNLKKISGKSLLQISIETSKKSKYLTKLILTSDSDKIIANGKKFNVEIPFKRKKYLSGDKSNIYDVIRDALKRSEKYYNIIFDLIVILQPTTPFRTAKQIDECIKMLLKFNSDACITIKEPDYPPHWTLKLKNNKLSFLMKSNLNFTRRQDAPKTYIPAGSVYVLKKECLMKLKKNLPNQNTLGLVVSAKEGINIDNIYQLELARKLANE